MAYDLWYWDGIPGRGEFVRLALEAAGIPYRECARQPGASGQALVDDMRSPRKQPPFAPPYLVAGRLPLGQTANILLYLGDTHGLAPASAAGRYWTNQMQLTLADMVDEAPDPHTPVAASEYRAQARPAGKAGVRSWR